MEQKETYSFRKLLFLGTAVVLSHFAVVIWHLFLLVKLQSGTANIALVFLIAINLIPVIGMIMFCRGRPKVAGWMVILPLGVAFIIGTYAHFLSLGTDNVFRMPPGEWRLSFQTTALLLAVLEAPGCWIGIRILRMGPVKG